MPHSWLDRLDPFVCSCDYDFSLDGVLNSLPAFGLAGGMIGETGVFTSSLRAALVGRIPIGGTGELFPIARSVGASGNKLYNKLARLGNQAAGATGKQASTLLQKMARQAGLEVRSGGKHLKVINPTTGNTVTVIPHSPHARGTIKGIAEAILREAGF